MILTMQDHNHDHACRRLGRVAIHVLARSERVRLTGRCHAPAHYFTLLMWLHCIWHLHFGTN